MAAVRSLLSGDPSVVQFDHIVGPFHDEQLRLDHQGARESDTLLLPARELRGPLVRVVRKPDELEHAAHSLIALDRIDPGDRAELPHDPR